MTLPQFDAVFFDLDGTLIDTETVAQRTGMAAFAEVGFPVDHAFMARLVGVDLPTAAGIIGAALPGIDHPALQRVWRDGFTRAIETDLPLKLGAVQLLAARLAPMALVTSSGRAEAHHKLQLTGLDVYFDAIITLADVATPKPHPEPYLIAARRLGFDSARCLVFEDSETGAEAAHRAGCTVVQVPDVGPASGKWAHHLAPDLLTGAKMAGLLA